MRLFDRLRRAGNPRPKTRRRLLRPSSLRARVELTFGLLALAISALLSVVSWVTVSRYLLSQREDTAVTETALDRSAVLESLGRGSTSVASILGGLPTNDAVSSVALVSGHWYGTNPALGPATLPTALVDAAATQQTVTQRVLVDDHLYLMVGVPLQQPGDALFEVYSLVELDSTLRAMAWVLALAAVVTTFVGVGLGRSASRVALRPLAELTRVAGAVAGGRLDARLRPRGDPDLDPLAESFNRTVSQLEHRVRADSRFAVDVSHELRTPLMTMLNSMEVITNRKALLPESVREPVDLLADDLDRFRSLVVDLLEISRHDAGEDLVLEPVDIGELTRRAADAVAGRPVTSVVGAGPDLVALVDKRRLERVVANLVGNAQSHGGGCEAVTVSRSNGTVRIVVDDAGPGIAESDRGRVFDRFARAGGSGEQGVGLGLAIVQRHVSAHGGRVAVETSPQGGARFVVELPVR
ncbi:HAMP domain-containing sensor histidine kinase [Intrasporangium mesophilum]